MVPRNNSSASPLFVGKYTVVSTQSHKSSIYQALEVHGSGTASARMRPGVPLIGIPSLYLPMRLKGGAGAERERRTPNISRRGYYY